MKDFDPKRLGQQAAEKYRRNERGAIDPITPEWVGRISERIAEAIKDHPKVAGMMDMPRVSVHGREISAHTEHLSSSTSPTLHCHPDDEARLVAEISNELCRKFNENRTWKRVYPFIILNVMASAMRTECAQPFIVFSTRYGIERHLCSSCKKVFVPDNASTAAAPTISDLVDGPRCEACLGATVPDLAAAGLEIHPYQPKGGDVLFFSYSNLPTMNEIADWCQRLEAVLSVGLANPVRVVCVPESVKPVQTSSNLSARLAPGTWICDRCGCESDRCILNGRFENICAQCLTDEDLA